MRRRRGAQGSPGPDRLVPQDSGDPAPREPPCRVLSLGARTLGRRDSEAPTPSTPLLPPWRAPEWGVGEKAVDSTSVDRWPRFGIPVWESNSPPPSVRPPLAPVPQPGNPVRPVPQEKVGGPAPGSSANSVHLATPRAPARRSNQKRKSFPAQAGGPAGSSAGPRPPLLPSAPRGVLAPCTAGLRDPGVLGGAGREERYFCAESVRTPGDQRDSQNPLPSASPCGSVRWAARPKLPPTPSLRRRLPESPDPDRTSSSF